LDEDIVSLSDWSLSRRIFIGVPIGKTVAIYAFVIAKFNHLMISLPNPGDKTINHVMLCFFSIFCGQVVQIKANTHV